MRPEKLLPAHLADRLRPWSGFDEDYVRATRTDNATVVCNTLLARCFGDAQEIDCLPIHDRDLALVALRWATFGSVLPVEIACHGCSTEHEVTIDLDRLSRPASVPDEVSFVADGCEVVLGVPSAADQVVVSQSSHLGPELARASLLARCIRALRPVAHGAERRTRLTAEDVLGLAPGLRARVEAELEAAIPDVDLDLVLDCPACSTSIDAGVQLGAIVLAELRERSSHLLRDVHVLARTYHWSERDILSLSSGRRREYISMIDVDHTTALFIEARD